MTMRKLVWTYTALVRRAFKRKGKMSRNASEMICIGVPIVSSAALFIHVDRYYPIISDSESGVSFPVAPIAALIFAILYIPIDRITSIGHFTERYYIMRSSIRLAKHIPRIFSIFLILIPILLFILGLYMS